MVSLEIEESVVLRPQIVAVCSLAALLSMIVAVIGIKLRWFRHRLTFEGLPTTPKRESREDSGVVVTGFYRKTTEFDNFVAVERPQSLPPIRLDKRSRARHSHFEAIPTRHTILTVDTERSEHPDTQAKTASVKDELKELVEQDTKQDQLENETKSRKKAPQPPNIQQSSPRPPRPTVDRTETNGFIPETPDTPDTKIQTPPPPPAQKKRSLFSLKDSDTPETKPKANKVRVLKPKHQKNKQDRLSIISKTSSPRDPRDDDDKGVKILAESEIFAPVPIPRNQVRQEDKTEPREPAKESRTLQFADNDEIIGESENYDSWDLVSKHRQSLNHLTAPPPKPKPRDSVAYHRQKVPGQTFLLGVDNDDDDEEESRPKTLREMQKERQKLSLTKDISDTEA
ncbi:hypothetical protein DMENIID0001_059290 [Sergentomyia squamirostris]